jgi:hypothetical protein
MLGFPFEGFASVCCTSPSTCATHRLEILEGA